MPLVLLLLVSFGIHQCLAIDFGGNCTAPEINFVFSLITGAVRGPWEAN